MIPNSVLAENTSATIQINKPYKSLRTIFMGFYSDRYRELPAARKFSRMNWNINKWQITAGSKKIPDLPIECTSAGNNFGKSNNIFITQIYKAMNAFSSTQKDSILNPANMAFNGTGSWWAWGRFLIAINWDSISSDSTWISGLNTKKL